MIKDQKYQKSVLENGLKGGIIGIGGVEGSKNNNSRCKRVTRGVVPRVELRAQGRAEIADNKPESRRKVSFSARELFRNSGEMSRCLEDEWGRLSFKRVPARRVVGVKKHENCLITYAPHGLLMDYVIHPARPYSWTAGAAQREV